MIKGYASTPLGQLHYVESGSGTPVLLLHQTPRSFDEFAEVLPLLARNHRAIAMDMLGFGLSAPEAGGQQSIEGMAQGAVALLEALEIDRAHVLGHHTGGAVAIEVAAAAPDRVAGLVLSSAPWTDPGYRESHADGDGVDVVDHAADGSHLVELWSLRSPYYPADMPGLLDRFIRDALAPGVDPGEGHLACARYVMEDRIGLVTAPTLLIGADADPFAFPSIAPLSEHLTGVDRLETAVVAGGMIPLMEQKPAEVVSFVEPFLASVDAAS